MFVVFDFYVEKCTESYVTANSGTRSTQSINVRQAFLRTRLSVVRI